MIKITEDLIKKICKILNANFKYEDNHYIISIFNREDIERRISIELYDKIDNYDGFLVVVFTPNSHLQLHHCNNIHIAEDLGEITFYAEENDKFSGIVIEDTGGCSFYSNLTKSQLSGDISQLGIDVMMYGVTKSLKKEL